MLPTIVELQWHCYPGILIESVLRVHQFKIDYNQILIVEDSQNVQDISYYINLNQHRMQNKQYVTIRSNKVGVHQTGCRRTAGPVGSRTGKRDRKAKIVQKTGIVEQTGQTVVGFVALEGKRTAEGQS